MIVNSRGEKPMTDEIISGVPLGRLKIGDSSFNRSIIGTVARYLINDLTPVPIRVSLCSTPLLWLLQKQVRSQAATMDVRLI